MPALLQRLQMCESSKSPHIHTHTITHMVENVIQETEESCCLLCVCNGKHLRQLGQWEDRGLVDWSF